MRKFLTIILLLSVFVVQAQNNIISSDLIRTLQVTTNDDWEAPPIIKLNSEDFVRISFDELSHEYHRYTYYITHCDANWKPSSLFEIDYLDGFNGRPIDDYENSINTTMLYTHYQFCLPNEDVRMKLSGNYLVKIYDDENPDSPVIQAHFSVLEPRVQIGANVTSNTDIDTNKSHQQVSFNISYGGYGIVSPQTELTAKIFQNRRTDNCVTIKEPTYITANQLQYVHNKKLIFDAGNEYRRFEVLNMYNSSLNVDYIRFFSPYFHAFLYPDKVRKNYSYDEDQDGRFLIRYDEAGNSNIEADYLFVHFALQSPQLTGGDFYLEGDITNDRFIPEYKLKYNEATNAYENIQLMKQGAYNYLYLWVPNGSTTGYTGPGGGNFYETENEYMVLLYHCPFGERYDKLVGYCQVRFSQD